MSTTQTSITVNLVPFAKTVSAVIDVISEIGFGDVSMASCLAAWDIVVGNDPLEEGITREEALAKVKAQALGVIDGTITVELEK